MSDLRPRRTGRSWSLHTDQTGNPGAVDTFQVLVAPTITGVTNGGTFLSIAISDTNAGADMFNYTYVVQRSVDGSPFSVIGNYVAGGIVGNLADYTIPVLAISVGLSDGSQVATSSTVVTYVTVLQNSSTQAFVLFDTTVTRADGHSQVLPSGTAVTLPVAKGGGDALAVPKGHVYAYKVMVLNKFKSTAFSASGSATVNSTWSAQTLAAPSRVNNKVTLSWTDPNTYATGSRIEIWKDVNGAGYALLATIVKAAPAMPTTYIDAFDFLTLIPATYSYKLRAASDVPKDTGPFSAPQSLIVNFTLNQVTALTATPVGYTQINLAWTDPNAPANEAGVYIDRSVGALGQFQRIASIAAGATSYTDVFSSEPGQTYGYRVTPFNALHPGPASAPATATTAMLTPSVSSLQQLADVGVRVSITDTNLHASSYTIQRSINGGAFSAVGTSSSTQFDDFVALSIGNSVAYKVQASNAYVTSPFSTASSILIGRILVAPTGVTPTIVNFRAVNVTWVGLNSGNRGVYLYRSINGAATTLIATLPKDARSYTDSFQTIPGQVYAYQVQDFDNQEVGPLSDFGVVDSTFDAPISLQIAGTTPPDHITLQWSSYTLPQSTNEDYTSVERAFGAGGFSEVARIAFGQQPTFFAQITGGVPGDAVMFRVRKVKQPYFIFGTVQVPANFGDYSQIVSTVSPLSVPTAVTVTRNLAGVNHIAWSDSNTLATGFKVFRQVTIGGVSSALVQIATINNPAARGYDDTVDSGQNYIFTYSVLAFNATNSSVYSGYGTLTTRLPLVILELVQNGRTNIEIDFAIPNYSGVGSDKMQLFKTLNSGTPSVVATFNYPFFSGFLYNDIVAVGDTASYSVRVFSATELGPSSVPVSITVGDIIDTPLGRIEQVRIHGARNKFVQRDVFAVGLGGIAKISFDPVTFDPIVASNLLPSVTNAYSGISGDQTRLVVFTGLTPGSGQAVVVDANNLAVIASTSTEITDTYTYNGGASIFGQAKLDYYANVESGNYLDGATGSYQGWGLVNYTAIQNMNPNFPLRLVPWSNTLSSINLSSFYVNGATSGQTSVATPFSLASITPLRLENLNGDCAFCVNPVGNFSTFYRAQRSGNSYVKLVDIPARVMDFVSDGVSKILAVTIRGEIYLIDMQFNPTNPSFEIIGQVPGTPINSSGDLIDPAIDFMSIELMASQKVAVAVGTHTSQRKFAGGFQSQSFVYIFNVPGVLTTTGSLTLASTIASIEKISSIAFDGMKYIYGTSNDNQIRLLRFNAGF